MRRSRCTVRACVAGFLALLVAALLATDYAAAQPVTERERTPATAEQRFTASSSDPSGQAEDDRQPRSSTRGTLRLPAPAARPGCVCGCDDRSARGRAARGIPGPVAAGDAVPKTRSVEVPLLHQVFRC